MRTRSTWPKTNAFSFVNGSASFVDDVRLPDTLHMAVVRSTHAHARLINVDTSEAETHGGVVRIVDGREASVHLGVLPYQFGDPELIGGRRSRLYALPVDTVRYIGEPIAVVAAEDPRAARTAAAMVKVEYEDLPAIVDPRRFLGGDLSAADAGHLVAENHVRTGDPERYLELAEHTLEAEFSVPRSSTAPIETRGYLADWNREVNRLTVHASHQQPFQLRAELAEVLNLPAESIRVVVPNVGGSFGLKMTGAVEEPLVCLLSLLCERPVKWIEDRAECFLGGGREQMHRVRAGFTSDGRVQALVDEVVIPVGAESVSPGWRQGFVSSASMPTAYDIPHVAVRSRVVATNLPPWHSCRGFGKEAPIFVMERLMDLVARRVGRDPADIRRRNLISHNAMPHRMPSGYQIDSGDFHAVLAKTLGMAGYGAARDAASSTDAPVSRGVGLAFEVTPEGGGHAAGRLGAGITATVAAPETATVRIDRDGNVTVLTGVTNPGGGNDTSLAILTAEELGTTRDRITVVLGDTELCPPGTGNASSRGIAVGGAAVVLAARDIAAEIRDAAADLLDVPQADVNVANGHVEALNRHAVSLGDLCAHVLDRRGETDRSWLSRTRSYRPDPPDDPQFRYSYPYFSSGAYVAEVSVDPATGVVRLLALTAVHDCGRVIEPTLVEGQLQGAMAMGVGLALYEESRFGPDGEPLTRSFKEYLAPRANDLPDFVIGHHETQAPYTLLGAKGAGEAGVGGAMAAVANAVDDALHRMGANAPVTSLPLSPSAVLAMLPDPEMFG